MISNVLLIYRLVKVMVCPCTRGLRCNSWFGSNFAFHNNLVYLFLQMVPKLRIRLGTSALIVNPMRYPLSYGFTHLST